MESNQAHITISFRGVRGSYPMPGSTTVRYGGNTACQEIHAGGRLLIFDAGTGIIGLGRDLLRSGGANDIALFFSHSHHDHTNGFLYFAPAYHPKSHIHFFGPGDGSGGIMASLEKLSGSAVHPVRLADMGMHYSCDILRDGDAVVWRPKADRPVLAPPETVFAPEDVVVRVLENKRHPVEGVLNFRLEYMGKVYVYASDIEGDEEHGDAELAAFSRNADLLAHDGQYDSEEYRTLRRGWGHSTVRMAVRTAVMAGVKRLAIIHHEPAYDDDRLDAMEREGKALFPNLFFAREGLTVTL